MTTEQSIIWFVAALLTYFILSWMEDSLFYRTEQKYCDKYKGNCEQCNCWSCKRTDYIKRGDKNKC